MDVDSEIWAITAYFNPSGFSRRLKNYHTFRKYLNVPLLTVELAFNHQHELGPNDAEIYLPLSQGDVMWQKERLLNIAVENLPKQCRYVAWLDYDILFADRDWPQKTHQLLQKYELIQLYENLVHLPANWVPGMSVVTDEDRHRQSLASVVQDSRFSCSLFSERDGSVRAKVNSGMAWAASRALLEEYSLYDSLILGMGDRAISAAAFGFLEETMDAHQMNDHQRQHFVVWVQHFYDRVRGCVGNLPTSLLHLWHGEPQHRLYAERYSGFAQHSFRPDVDIQLGNDKTWQWSSAKPTLHEDVASYFSGRHEDSCLETQYIPAQVSR